MSKSIGLDPSELSQAHHDLFMLLVAELHATGIIDAHALGDRISRHASCKDGGIADYLSQVADACHHAPAGADEIVN